MSLMMSKFSKLTVVVFCLAFVSPAFSHQTESAHREHTGDVKYDQKFRENYNKYKSFSPAKKERMQKLHKSLNSLTPEQKRKLRERVLNKNKPNY